MAGAPGGYIVSRRFYYDGDRRIARISTQPYAADGTNLGDPGKLKEEIDLEQEIDWLSDTDRLWVWDPEDVDRLVDMLQRISRGDYQGDYVLDPATGEYAPRNFREPLEEYFLLGAIEE